MTNDVSCPNQVNTYTNARLQLQSIPESIAELNSLTSLDIRDNELRNLPAALGCAAFFTVAGWGVIDCLVAY